MPANVSAPASAITSNVSAPASAITSANASAPRPVLLLYRMGAGGEEFSHIYLNERGLTCKERSALAHKQLDLKHVLNEGAFESEGLAPSQIVVVLAQCSESPRLLASIDLVFRTVLV